MSKVFRVEDAKVRASLILSDDVGLGFRVLPACVQLVAQAEAPVASVSLVVVELLDCEWSCAV